MFFILEIMKLRLMEAEQISYGLSATEGQKHAWTQTVQLHNWLCTSVSHALHFKIPCFLFQLRRCPICKIFLKVILGSFSFSFLLYLFIHTISMFRYFHYLFCLYFSHGTVDSLRGSIVIHSFLHTLSTWQYYSTCLHAKSLHS